MATLIPALDACVSRMTAGERRLAERLEQKLDEDKDDDGVPLLKPISCGCDGAVPLIIRLPSLRDEATKIAELLNAETIKVLTTHGSKGLEFAVVVPPGLGQMPAPGDDEQEEARLFYVAVKRATRRLVITVRGMGVWKTCVWFHEIKGEKLRFLKRYRFQKKTHDSRCNS